MIKYFSFLLFILFLSVSCQDTVDLKLDDADPVIVIDAKIQANQSCVVKLSKSHGFWDNSSYEPINGATVKLLISGGNESEILVETEAGLYRSNMKGLINTEYKLEVLINDRKYTAKAYLPPVVPIDSLYIYNIQGGTEPWYSPCVVFKDPQGVKNYYYTILSVNDKVMRSIYVINDQYRDGLQIQQILYFNKEDNGDEELKLGDKIRVEMQSVNEETYTFFNSISNNMSTANNPISGFDGGAYGNFKAFSSVFDEMIITEDKIHSVR